MITKTTERAIAFNAEMVRAILDGRKTQTRRIVKHKLSPTFKDFEVCDDPDKFRVDYPVKGYPRLHVPIQHRDDDYTPWDECIADEVECPYEVGQHLWVRESTLVHGFLPGLRKMEIEYCADGVVAVVDWPERIKQPKPSHKLANGCYREASRLILEVTGVRVERLKDISVSDIEAEGLQQDARLQSSPDFKRDFQRLWESINGPDSWSANPWVWVVEFKRIKA